MKVTDRIKDKITCQEQGHLKVIYEVIYNGYGIEVLGPTSIKGARTPLPDIMNNDSMSEFLIG